VQIIAAGWATLFYESSQAGITGQNFLQECPFPRMIKAEMRPGNISTGQGKVLNSGCFPLFRACEH